MFRKSCKSVSVVIWDREGYADEKGGRSTNIGYPAEEMYGKLGWVSFGVLPRNGICPRTGELRDERYFYKDLRGV